MELSLSETIIIYRKRAGMTQKELAEAAAVSVPTIVNIEAGGDTRLSTLYAVAGSLGLEVDIQLKEW